MRCYGRGVDAVGVSWLAKVGLKLVWSGGKQVLKEVAVREVVHQAELQALKVGAEAGSKVMTEVGLLPQLNRVESIINFSTFEQLSKSNPALQAFIRGNKEGSPLVSRLILKAYEAPLAETHEDHKTPGSYRRQSVRVGDLVPPPAPNVY